MYVQLPTVFAKPNPSSGQIWILSINRWFRILMASNYRKTSIFRLLLQDKRKKKSPNRDHPKKRYTPRTWKACNRTMVVHCIHIWPGESESEMDEFRARNKENQKAATGRRNFWILVGGLKRGTRARTSHHIINFLLFGHKKIGWCSVRMHLHRIMSNVAGRVLLINENTLLRFQWKLRALDTSTRRFTFICHFSAPSRSLFHRLRSSSAPSPLTNT